MQCLSHPSRDPLDHRVLIFSQFTRMLDVLQDYMRMANWPVERIDGSVKSRDRQAAIDRFTNGERR